MHALVQFAPVLYLAGPMTGLAQYNYPRFAQAAATLRNAGYTVLSPHENDLNPETADRSDYLRHGIGKLIQCTGIVLLEGFENSAGAKLELSLAHSLGMPSATYQEFISNNL